MRRAPRRSLPGLEAPSKALTPTRNCLKCQRPFAPDIEFNIVCSTTCKIEYFSQLRLKSSVETPTK
jgi:hypothetical protein